MPLPARRAPDKFHDPAAIGYPPTLPVEIALRMRPVKEVCESYGIDHNAWKDLCANPVFVDDLKARMIELQSEGSTFKLKARLQAEELLQTSWNLIHESNAIVPPSVKADLIKFTVRAAGLDGSKDQALAASQQNALQINIDLSGR